MLKPGKLTEEEFEIMKKHTLYGAEVLQASEDNLLSYGKSIFTMGVDIARCHHEKWNGSGYPYQKRGTLIPLSARIVAVADVFDALTSKRPYKVAFSFEKSFAMLLSEKGKHFDPVIINALEKKRENLLNLYDHLNALDEAVS